MYITQIHARIYVAWRTGLGDKSLLRFIEGSLATNVENVHTALKAACREHWALL